jgi:hypothetical protein
MSRQERKDKETKRQGDKESGSLPSVYGSPGLRVSSSVASPFKFSNPRFRLFLLFAGLFVVWIGWLAYLAITSTRPIVLSRPQFLVSKLDIIAEVHADNSKPDPKVDVREVHWPPKGMEQLVGRKITVGNLAQCDGWTGPGLYILPLATETPEPKNGSEYEVAKIPPSPGFSPAKSPPRIYPKTPETLRQLNEIQKE